MKISNERFREIAENAISFLNDNDLLEEFLEDRDIALSTEEEKYFEVDAALIR